MVSIIYSTSNNKVVKMHFSGHCDSDDALSRKICIGLSSIVLSFCHYLKRHFENDVTINIHAKHPTKPSINDVDIFVDNNSKALQKCIEQFDVGLDWLLDNGGKYYISKVVR